MVATVLLLPGCLQAPGGDDGPESSLERCRVAPGTSYTYWLSDGYALTPEGPPDAGSAPGNGFAEAFATDELTEWLSEPAADGLWVFGVVELAYWARNVGTPAPIVDAGDPTQGYHFYNQFGSDRSFQPGYAVEYADVLPVPGSVDHYVQELQMPKGGFVVEAGDRLRVLLTSLVLDDADGSGHEILYGGDTPSRIRFTATCFPAHAWHEAETEQADIELRGHRGLLTGAVPPEEGVNQQTVPFTLLPEIDRLTVALQQGEDPNPAKDDMDLTLLDGAGKEIWSIGSPYSDESGTLWRPNLDAVMPPGQYAVRVDSYSGHAYRGTLTITQETGEVLSGGDPSNAP